MEDGGRGRVGSYYFPIFHPIFPLSYSISAVETRRKYRRKAKGWRKTEEDKEKLIGREEEFISIYFRPSINAFSFKCEEMGKLLTHRRII